MCEAFNHTSERILVLCPCGQDRPLPLKIFHVLLQRSSEGQVKSAPKLADENYEDDEDEQGETLCGSCGGNYNGDEFWICCDVCERWFHGKCVKITPAKAESIKQYKCPSCSMKKAGRSH